MAYLPQDYSKHESKIVFGLSSKSLIIIFCFGAMGLFIVKATFFNWFVKTILLIPILILLPFVLFYRTTEGDDLITYIFNLLLYYTSPKYLIYKKENPQERRANNGKKE